MNSPQEERGQTPEVSVAIPVYNGEPFIEDAITAVTDQTFRDLELIVVDNASTDRTYEIASRFSENDGRVRVHRNETNIGLSPNFARALELSKGRYFKWLAADDSMSVDFIGAAKTVLDERPDVVIATAPMPYVDESGEMLQPDSEGVVTASYGETFRMMPFPEDLQGDSPSRRFRSMLLDGTSNVFTELYFGLIRGEILRSVPPVGAHMGAEKALLGRLLLRGAAVQLEGPLLLRRLHPEHFGAQSREDTLRGLDPVQRISMLKSPIDQLVGYARAINDSPLTLRERRRAYSALAEKSVNTRTLSRFIIPGPANYLGLGKSRS